MTILDMLKGIGGTYEINRVLGAAGVSTYIVAAPVFVAWNMSRGITFDLIAFCTAYPTGLGIAIGAIAGSVALKDRNVATAKATDAATRVVSAKADTADAANVEAGK